MIVLDTNVLSEALRARPSETVIEWLDQQDPESVFTTAITQAEILYGIELLPAGKRRSQLASVAERVFGLEFRARILGFDVDAALIYPAIIAKRRTMGRPMSQLDAMIAAIVRSHQAALATRNAGDFEHCGISVVNPWAR